MSRRTGAGATINPDNIWLFYATAAMTAVVFLASVVISFFGLHAVGVAQGLPSHFAWATPIMIDAAILVFTFTSLIHKRRGNKFARWFAIFATAFFVILSMSMNGLHSYVEVGWGTPMQIAATVVNTLAPLSIWITTESLVSLVTKQVPAARSAAAPKAARSARARKPATRQASAAKNKTQRQTKPQAPRAPQPRPESQPEPRLRPAPALTPSAPAPDRVPAPAQAAARQGDPVPAFGAGR